VAPRGAIIVSETASRRIPHSKPLPRPSKLSSSSIQRSSSSHNNSRLLVRGRKQRRARANPSQRPWHPNGKTKTKDCSLSASGTDSSSSSNFESTWYELTLWSRSRSDKKCSRRRLRRSCARKRRSSGRSRKIEISRWRGTLPARSSSEVRDQDYVAGHQSAR